MRFAAIFAVAAFAAAVSAQDPTPTLPSNVDKTKPEAVKSYFTSISNDMKSVEAKITSFLPSDKVGPVKELIEGALVLVDAALATATEPAELADLATKLAAADAGIKKMAAGDPKSVASSVAANLSKDVKSMSSAINSAVNSVINSVISSLSKENKTNAAMSDASVSAARLAAGVIAGTAAFAAFF
ncbi:hypothetical protein GQ42DRAFT_162637 [Ramicandelaber brevisporus]|nr:hypothetical protein GQ42DRAFT_162637 [Ramicandelaber brevisporus]